MLVVHPDDGMNPPEISKNWLQRGFSCALWIDPPGQVWPDFIHSHDELIQLLEGEIELIFNGETIRPAIGDEVLIPAGCSHTVINVGAQTNRWLYGYKR